MTSPPRRPALGPLVAPLINKAADLQVAATHKASVLFERSYARAKELHVPEAVRTAVVTGFRGAVNAAESLLNREAPADRTPKPKPAGPVLPLADYESQSLASVRARLSRLSLRQLEELHAYEAAHGARTPFLTALDNRIAKVQEGKPGAAARSPRPRKPPAGS